MNWNPFTIRYGHHYALWQGRRRRRKIVKRLAELGPPGGGNQQTLALDVLCMLGRSTLPETVVAMRSFLRFAGQPERLVMVSDGSLTSEDRVLLEKALGRAEVLELEEVFGESLPAPVTDRLADSWMVRKQALLMSIPKERPALFLDSDIVFFPGAESLGEELAQLGDRPAFMVDVKPNFDGRMLREEDPLDPPLNSGLLYMPRLLDWSKAVDRFAELPPDGGLRFTDQTMSHLAFHEAGAVPLDPDRYALKIDDRFHYRDRYANLPGVVCRHYVSTIRHMMWLLDYESP